MSEVILSVISGLIPYLIQIRLSHKWIIAATGLSYNKYMTVAVVLKN
ncbi:MAG: hypothetical protein ACI9LG_002597, partial [Moritella dasanensis]